jgi:hypothetical protein
MHPIGTGLARMFYTNDEGCLKIHVPDGEVAMVGPIGRAMKLVVGPAHIQVNPNSSLVMGGMEIEIYDKPIS